MLGVSVGFKVRTHWTLVPKTRTFHVLPLQNGLSSWCVNVVFHIALLWLMYQTLHALSDIFNWPLCSKRFLHKCSIKSLKLPDWSQFLVFLMDPLLRQHLSPGFTFLTQRARFPEAKHRTQRKDNNNVTHKMTWHTRSEFSDLQPQDSNCCHSSTPYRHKDYHESIMITCITKRWTLNANYKSLYNFYNTHPNMYTLTCSQGKGNAATARWGLA